MPSIESYEEALRVLGCAVRHIPVADELPDSLFVEDAAIVLDEVAIITRPGALSRRAECDAVARVLAEYRPLQTIAAPGTIDGGDVLRLGRTLYVGRSTRTNADGIASTRDLPSRRSATRLSRCEPPAACT